MRHLIKAKNDALRYLRKKEKQASLKHHQLKVDGVLDMVAPLLTKHELVTLKERLKSNTSKSRQYSADFKHLAIRIAFKGTASYKYLSWQLHLPPRSTMSRWMSNIDRREGLDEDLFRLMKQTVKSMEEQDCVLLRMDEMSLGSVPFTAGARWRRAR